MRNLIYFIKKIFIVFDGVCLLLSIRTLSFGMLHSPLHGVARLLFVSYFLILNHVILPSKLDAAVVIFGRSKSPKGRLELQSKGGHKGTKIQ